MYTQPVTQAERYRSIALRAFEYVPSNVARIDDVWMSIARASLELARRSLITNQRTLASDLHEDR